MQCLICNNISEFIFDSLVLTKYEVSYFKCKTCGFIQTENPYWLKEAYSNAISLLDVGLVERNINLSKVLAYILKEYFNYSGRFLDYAGGYGLFVRIMRDKGFDFYRQDIYCDNIFAKYFDLLDLSNRSKFELLTAFEVFEHLANPLQEIKLMLEYSDSILFSTELQPKIEFKTVKDWDYFVPETGQHIAFYTQRTLEFIAQQNNCFLFTNNQNLHLLTTTKLPSNPFVFRNVMVRKITHKVRDIFNNNQKRPVLHSWRQRDYKYVLSKFYNK